MVSRFIVILSLFFTSCVVRPPVDYQGDMSNRYLPIEGVFDPDQGGYIQPQPSREIETRQEQTENPEKNENENKDIYWEYTEEGAILRSR